MNYLDEPGWDELLDAIKLGNVVPVVGPSMVRVWDEPAQAFTPLQPWLAWQVAERLGLPAARDYLHTAAVARAWLAQPGRKMASVQAKTLEVLKRIAPEPCEALLALAGIVDFSLFLTTTADPLLALALDRVRPGFDPARHVCGFTMAGLSGRSSDVSEASPALYHLLGDTQSVKFPVSEEDTMELVYSFIAGRKEVPVLCHRLKGKQLLILGSPADDWVVRFLLRAMFENALSKQVESHLLFDHPGSLSEGLVVFLQSTLRSAKVIHGAPVDFALELAARWRERSSEAVDDRSFVHYLPERMPTNAVFISYASEDLADAVKLARALLAAGLQVWMDKQRLTSGDAYHTALEAAIKHNCRFFVSLISPATEADTERKRFVHRERDWAAARHTPGVYFYLPVSFALPAGSLPRCEPAAVKFREQGADDAREGISMRRLNPQDLKAWVSQVRQWREDFLRTGQQPGYAQ